MSQVQVLSTSVQPAAVIKSPRRQSKTVVDIGLQAKKGVVNELDVEGRCIDPVLLRKQSVYEVSVEDEVCD